jgi:hypothetical protein
LAQRGQGPPPSVSSVPKSKSTSLPGAKRTGSRAVTSSMATTEPMATPCQRSSLPGTVIPKSASLLVRTPCPKRRERAGKKPLRRQSKSSLRVPKTPPASTTRWAQTQPPIRKPGGRRQRRRKPPLLGNECVHLCFCLDLGAAPLGQAELYSLQLRPRATRAFHSERNKVIPAL